MALSTATPERVPDIEMLSRLTKSIAMLDAIICVGILHRTPASWCLLSRLRLCERKRRLSARLTVVRDLGCGLWRILFLLTMMAAEMHAAENVEITVELTSTYPSGKMTNRHTVTATCVVNTNSWFIQGNFLKNADRYWWLVGTNVVEHTIVTDSFYLQQAKDFVAENFLEQKPRQKIAGSYPRAGHKFTKVYPSPQGQLAAGGIENAVWLAYCSGTYLRQDGRQIPMPLGTPSDAFEYSDKTIVFNDDFGLPKSVELYATNGQLVCEYKVLQATNFPGRTFPLKFRAAHFWNRPGHGGTTIPSRSDLLGRTTLIRIGTQPELPEEVRKELQTLR